MRAVFLLAVCLGTTASDLCPAEASGRRHRPPVVRAPGAPRLGPWVEEGWRREDWSRAPAVREWGYSAPRDVDPWTGDPSSTAEYPWGYTTPFVRVGKKCVAMNSTKVRAGWWFAISG
jgi:hypothetical protein